MNPPTRELADYAILANCRFSLRESRIRGTANPPPFACSLSRFRLFSRVGHLPEVCTLSRPMIFQSVSAPLQSGIRFFWHLIPISSSLRLTAFLPLRERYGLTTFHRNDTTGLGSLCTPKVFLSMTGHYGEPVPTLFNPESIFGLLLLTTLQTRVQMS